MDNTKKPDMQRFHCIELTRHSFYAPPPGMWKQLCYAVSIALMLLVFFWGGGGLCFAYVFVSSLSKKSKVIAMIKNIEG